LLGRHDPSCDGYPLLHQAPEVRLCRCRSAPVGSREPCTHCWGRHKGAGPRFACLQTKRCAWLWSARYPCSIFHHLWSRLPLSFHHSSAAMSLQGSSSSSAPAIRRSISTHVAASSGPSYPCASHRFRSYCLHRCLVWSLFGSPVGSGRFSGLFATPQAFLESSRLSNGAS